ncbi:AlbA family DNA-binding domain-containing protein [Leptospira levettii]|uniref:ATP-binding protein n=1 Tax=Leptospira levettii TaxID=2023178 RepID=A0ABY2MH39_9LEPT|nr:ATP-binding protein [Leptospira levettii]TGL66506.1 ATP-binding protein [Leptospira levettii]
MNIEDLYNLIDLNKINEFVDLNQEENLYIDFKTLKSNELNSDDDKGNYAKALSGFANSEGGIIIWGVETQKKSEIDAASGIKEIENVKKSLTRIEQLTGELLSPKLVGVKNKIINTKENNGLIVTYIPPSDNPPHMALGKLHAYYKRSGESFYRMEHFDIADLFARKKSPKLEFCYAINKTGKGNNQVNCNIKFGLKNISKVIAKFPMLDIHLSNPYQLSSYGIDGNGNYGLERSIGTSGKSGWNRYIGNLGTVIHSNSLIYVVSSDTISVKIENEIKDLVVSFDIYSEGMDPISDSITILGEEIKTNALS